MKKQVVGIIVLAILILGIIGLKFYKDSKKSFEEDGIHAENLTDVTGNEVTPYTKNYEGFTSPETQTVTVEGDGSTVVEYLYKRNKYVLKINDRENLDSSSTPNGEYYYDTLITIKA